MRVTIAKSGVFSTYGYTPVVTPANANFYTTGLHPTLALHQLIASAVAPSIPAGAF